MKTEQEQIEQIEKVLKDSVTDYKHLKKKGVCYCYAETLIDHGYGDISEYKAENERLTKILNSLTFSEKETDIFGKPALLMFAGVKVEEAIKRVAEYDGLNAEIERLRTTLGQCNTELNSALESLKSQCREIGELKAGTKQAKIDVLNELKRIMTAYSWQIDINDVQKEIDKMLKEVENE